MGSSNLRIIIIENERLYAESLQLILSNHPRIGDISIFSNAEEALNSRNNNIPAIILLDIDLGLNCMSGLQAIPLLLDYVKGNQIIILTIFDEYEKVYEALLKGALGYIVKSDPAVKIAEAIFELESGGSPMSPLIARKIMQQYHNTNDNLELLSERETEIINLISKGYSEKEVAAKIFLSPLTVKKHISNIYSKLHVNSRTEALNKLFGA